MEKQLNEGDKIYTVNFYGKIINVFLIDRVTKSLAFGNGLKFSINYTGCLKRIPSNSAYNAPDFYIETPELKHKYKMQKIKGEVSKMNVDNLSEFKLIKIANILNEVEQ